MHDVIDLARWSATAQMLGADFEPLIDKVRQEIESRVAAIDAGSAARQTISFEAHAISSFAGNFGCMKLHAASCQLQNSARRDDVSDLEPSISEVRAAAETTIAFLLAARAGTPQA